MKRFLLLPVIAVFSSVSLLAQVTQINSNKSLRFDYPLSNNKSIYVSGIDQTLWATDGTLAGTIQLSADIKMVDDLGSLGFLDGKMFFSGNTLATGDELFVTDGTPGGTMLVSDINPGNASSSPGSDVGSLNGFLYFTAIRPAEGRELWRTNGTPAGTTLVKDIVPGPVGSNSADGYELVSTSTYLLFNATSPGMGIELWRSDGTDAGTVLLKDINTGPGSSDVRNFYPLNNLVLFDANDGVRGLETWKTDGTPAGTTILKDINPGPGSSKSTFGFSSLGYLIFNGRAYFNADDGANGNEIWSTDGTEMNTSLLKNIEPGAASSSDLVAGAVIVGNRFIFSSYNLTLTRTQLWESDGTNAGTKLFMDFPGGYFPVILTPYVFSSQTVNQALFQGNKFFFTAGTAAAGNELWISDGTVANTQLVKDIFPGTDDGIEGLSYIYTATTLFFPATNGTNGLELWRSDGTPAGTVMVADIVTGTGSSSPVLDFFIVNGKVLFEADNGDDPVLDDLYAVDGNFTPIVLPVNLTRFTVLPQASDALVQWYTSQEINSKNFTVQRGFDGENFQDIGTVAAKGSSATSQAYSFIDAGIANKGKTTVYYRLLSTDIDDKSTLSPIITLRLKLTGNWSVRMLGNPVSEEVKILLSGISEKVQLSIVDMNGRKMYTNILSPVNGQVSLPAASLPKGRYILLAESGKESKVLQFVK